MISSLFPTVALVTIIVTFYILAVALKDTLLKTDHPILSSRLVKLALTGICLSQLGYLILPEVGSGWWFLFNSSVFLGLFVMAFGYRSHYSQLKIDFVDYTSFLTIPTDYYDENDGVALRSYKEGTKIIVPSEADLLEIAKHYDENKYVIVFFKIKKGSFFPEHIHPKREITHLIKGVAEVIEGEHLLTPQTPFTVPPKTRHYFKAIEDCQGVSFIEK